MSRDRRSWIEKVTTWKIVADDALSEIRTLPPIGVVHAWRILRLLAICAVDPPSPASIPFDRRGMEALEEEILGADYDEGIRFPLAVLARCLTPGAESGFERLAWACMCAAEWAFGDGEAPRAGRSFIYAAARVSGSARYVNAARWLAACDQGTDEGEVEERTG